MYQWQAKKIIAMSRISRFTRDEAILRQNQQVNELFVLLDGKVEAWRTRSDGSTYKVSQTEPGGVFGVLLPDSGQQCFADMVAVEPVRVMVLRWQDLHHISKTYPRLALRLFRNLSRVIATMFGNLENTNSRFHDEASGALEAPVFREMLESMVLRANRYDEELSVFCVIVENPPEQFAYAQAYLVRTLGLIMQAQMRSPDIFGRLNSHFFCIACPTTSREQTRKLYKRIQTEIMREKAFTSFQHYFSYKLVSLGIGESAESFLLRIETEKSFSTRDNFVFYAADHSQILPRR
jgi:CRP-like cAMP-binding protein